MLETNKGVKEMSRSFLGFLVVACVLFAACNNAPCVCDPPSDSGKTAAAPIANGKVVVKTCTPNEKLETPFGWWEVNSISLVKSGDDFGVSINATHKYTSKEFFNAKFMELIEGKYTEVRVKKTEVAVNGEVATNTLIDVYPGDTVEFTAYPSKKPAEPFDPRNYAFDAGHTWKAPKVEFTCKDM